MIHLFGAGIDKEDFDGLLPLYNEGLFDTFYYIRPKNDVKSVFLINPAVLSGL